MRFKLGLILLALTATVGADWLLDKPDFVQTLHDETVVRSGPDAVEDRLDPIPSGVSFEVTERHGDWVKVKPLGAWIQISDLKTLEGPTTRPGVRSVSIQQNPNGSATITFKTDARAALQYEEQPELKRLLIRFPGARLAMGHVAHPVDLERLDRVDLKVEGDDLIAIINLGRHGLNGYSAQWEGQEKLRLHLAPPLPRGMQGLTVAVDAGHGGTDRGAVGAGGLEEKQVNLGVALALQRFLENEGARVVMTRTGDQELTEDQRGSTELAARVALSAQEGAQLFLSIHHNARPDPADGRVAHGTDMYYYRPQSQRLARALVKPVAAIYPESNQRYLWRSFHVIRQTEMPACLLELNYISNPEMERKHLSRPDYSERAAAAIVQGLKAYLAENGTL